MTLAVMWEGAEGTQELSPLPVIGGKRLARRRTSEKAQTQTAAHWMRVRQRGRAIRNESIGTRPSEDSIPLSFYTRGLNASQGHTSAWYCGLRASLALQRASSFQTANLQLLPAVDSDASVGALRTAKRAGLCGDKNLIRKLVHSHAVGI
jgi:hypothetical protein